MASKKLAGTAVLDTVIQESATNGSSETRHLGQEFAVSIRIIGTSPLLMHRYDVESVKGKGRAAKNSAEKKTDDVESYLYRDGKQIGIPGRHFHACLREAARRIPDPTSPRKSARDLVAAGIKVEPFMAQLGKTTWDYLDEQRAVVQRAAIPRIRPAFREGWSVTFTVLVLAPEYISEAWLQDLTHRAGRFQGLLDGRSIGYGLFRVVSFQKEKVKE